MNVKRFRTVALLAFFSLAGPAPAARAAEEPDEGMWTRLKRLDTDADGRLTAEELGGRRRLLQRLDSDGDGVITKKEAMAQKPRTGRGTSRRGPGATGSGGGERGLTLPKLDTDKDGRVSEKEWALFFEKADENKDNVLQQEEWIAAVGGRPLRDDAPKVGSPAPAVSALQLGTSTKVDLGKPKRITVLIFGSWT